LIEEPGQLAAATAEVVAPAAVPLEDPGPDELLEPGGENRGTDLGPPAELGEGEGAPPQLPDQSQRPAPAEQVEGALHCAFGGHWYEIRITCAQKRVICYGNRIVSAGTGSNTTLVA